MKRWPILFLLFGGLSVAHSADGVSFANEGVVAAPVEKV